MGVGIMKSLIEKWGYNKEYTDKSLVGTGDFFTYAKLNNLLVEAQEDGCPIKLFSIKTGRQYK